ncbi:MAG: type II secretion system protein GspK, partial [Gammaproteobacteria bacterium]
AMTRLAPHISALDTDTKINVNTATVSVLQSLADGMSQIDAEKLMEDRGEEGYETLADFLQHTSLAGRTVDQGRLSLASEYFLLHAEVKIGNVRTQMYSAIYRGKEGSKVWMRTRGIE